MTISTCTGCSVRRDGPVCWQGARPIRLLVLALALCSGGFAKAAEYRKAVLSDGTAVEYALVLPAQFDPDKVYPAILAFPGGGQSLRVVRGTLARFWEAEAVKRGFIVVCPAAPRGQPFSGKGADLIPEFLARFLDVYRIRERRFSVAGHSNGAVSAFRVAVRYPHLFRAVVAIAGFPESQADFDRLDRLKKLDVTMFVGDRDDYWMTGMQKTRDRLTALGIRVHFEIVHRNGHFLPDLSYENSGRIFDRLQR
jgi:pimeloyl-ACP methyl ester carboxylesterase